MVEQECRRDMPRVVLSVRLTLISARSMIFSSIVLSVMSRYTKTFFF